MGGATLSLVNAGECGADGQTPSRACQHALSVIAGLIAARCMPQLLRASQHIPDRMV